MQQFSLLTHNFVDAHQISSTVKCVKCQVQSAMTITSQCHTISPDLEMQFYKVTLRTCSKGLIEPVSSCFLLYFYVQYYG